MPASRFEHREALREILAAWTSQRDKRTVMAALVGTGAVCGAVLNTGEVLVDLHLWQRGMVQEVEHATRERYAMIGCRCPCQSPPVAR